MHPRNASVSQIPLNQNKVTDTTVHRLSGKCYKKKRGMNVDIVPNHPGPYISPFFGEKRECAKWPNLVPKVLKRESPGNKGGKGFGGDVYS